MKEFYDLSNIDEKKIHELSRVSLFWLTNLFVVSVIAIIVSYKFCENRLLMIGFISLVVVLFIHFVVKLMSFIISYINYNKMKIQNRKISDIISNIDDIQEMCYQKFNYLKVTKQLIQDEEDLYKKIIEHKSKSELFKSIQSLFQLYDNHCERLEDKLKDDFREERERIIALCGIFIDLHKGNKKSEDALSRFIMSNIKSF